MDRYIYLILIGIILVVGCDNATTKTNVVRLNTNTESNDITKANKNLSDTNHELNNSDKETSIIIIEKAQKDYQDSYNEYVKCLRESGPQTLETLQALTIYQKNYQIYQMLLKAESQK